MQRQPQSGNVSLVEDESLFRRWTTWMSTPPAGLDEERIKIYAVMNYAVVAGWMAYLTFMPLFVLLNLTWLIWVNTVVLTLFAGAFILSKLGWSFEAFLVCGLCVLGHSSLMTLVMGWSTGFHFHIITLLQFVMLFRYISLRARLYATAVGALTHIALWQLAHSQTPWAEVPETMVSTIGLLNVVVFLLITSGVAAYHGLVVSRHQEQLAEARDAAENANHAKSAFLANMSHELRTPLNAIIGYSELILEEAEDLGGDMPFTSDVEHVQKAGKHLLGLINDILDLSKIEAGRMTLEVITFDLGDLIRGLVDTVMPLAQDQSNVLELECSDNIGEFTSDPTKMRQILLNLVSNACKFTNQGTVTLIVDEAVVDGRPGVCIQVRDTGIGIKPAALERIFEEFSQADSSTSRQFGGTGLGLTITRRFAQMLGGNIEVSSEFGAGSTFTVVLPALTAEA